MNNDRKISALIISVAVLMEAAYAALYSTASPRIVIYVVVALFNSALYWMLVWLLRALKSDGERRLVFLIVTAGIVFRLTVLWLTPVGSDDIYRYIWDGKVQHAGFNPYQYEPGNARLRALHSDLLPARVSYPAMKTIYPPLTEWFFAAVFAVAGESILGFKIAFLLMEMLSIGLLIAAGKRYGMPPKYLALYCCSPLPVLQFALDGHCDVLMFPFILTALLLLSRLKDRSASILIGIAASAKLFPLILFPAVLRRHRWGARMVLSLLAAAVLLLAYLPSLLGNGSPFESLRVYSLNWAANGFLFELCYTALKNNQAAHVVMGGIFVLWAIFILRRGGEPIALMSSLLFGFFICSSTVYPWYLTVVALLLPLNVRWSGVAFVTVVSLAAIPWISYVTMGEWRNPLWLMAIEYIPLYIIAWIEYFPTSKRQLPALVNGKM
jgi:hypothetical protein